MNMNAGALPLVFGFLAAACGGSTSGTPRAVPYAGAAQSLAQQLAPKLSGRVAIMPLEADGETARSVGGLLLAEMTAELSNVPTLTLVERQELKAIIEEMALQQSGLIPEDQQIAMGKIAGAELLVTVRATLVGDAISLTARALSVEGGTSVAGATLAIQYDEGLKRAIADRDEMANLRTSKAVLAALDAVKSGDLESAQSFFEPLAQQSGERRSIGLMGLGAVTAAKGQGRPAKEYCETSRKLSDAPSYCWVIEGQLAYRAGDLEAAQGMLARALRDESTLTGWQRSEAANTLGLISVEQDAIEAALSFYQRAIELDPNNAKALSNRAKVLEETGDLDAAIALYARGLKADPDDAVLALLLRDAQLRASIAQDTAKQAKLARAAASLVAQKSSRSPKDLWATAPITVTITPFTEDGAPPQRMGETAFIEGAVRGGLEQTKGVQVVDRALLSQVLDELSLSSSDLADSSTALNVGKIVSARVILAGHVVRLGDESQVTLKLVETQSTRILATVQSIFDGETRLSALAHEIADRARASLIAEMPFRTTVSATKGTRVRLPVGSNTGIAEGDEFLFKSPSGERDLGAGTVVTVKEDALWVEVGKVRIPKNARAELKRVGG